MQCNRFSLLGHQRSIYDFYVYITYCSSVLYQFCNFVVIVCFSAGATGVLLNIDRVADKLAVEAPSLDVYGIVDSGWFLDTEQFRETECTNTFNCPPEESVRKGFRYARSLILTQSHSGQKILRNPNFFHIQLELVYS